MITLVLASHPHSLTMSNVSTFRKRRGVVRASIIRLTNRLKDLEKNADQPATLDLARGMTRKLDALDSDFRMHHHTPIDLIDDEETLQREHTMLDEQDDLVAELATRIGQLINLCASSSDSSPRMIAARRLSHLQKTLSSISEARASVDETVSELIEARTHASYDNMGSNSSISRRN